MILTDKGDNILLTGSDFSPRHTFECGQCFRFNDIGGGVYRGVAGGRAIDVWQDEQGVHFAASLADFNGFWAEYFDLHRDYDAISKGFPEDGFTQNAIAFGRGLHILKQEPWEALCSFIISQCNNISRIKTIIERLCRRFGREILWQGQSLYTFPSAGDLAGLMPEDLAFLRAGYRAKYILSAANAVAGGDIDLHALARMPREEAERRVTALEGVGTKVANCFLLFGAGHINAFPVDTWMKKAEKHYKSGFPVGSFGQYAGIAQQYIFYYTRENNL